MKKNDLIKTKTDFWTSNFFLKNVKVGPWASPQVGLNKRTRFPLTDQPGPFITGQK